MTMPKGPRRQVLDNYLDSAQEGRLRTSGSGWKRKARALETLGTAMKVGAEQAELRIGEQSLTGPALRRGMETTSTLLTSRSERLEAAGEALVQVATQIADTREARDSMKDLGDKPSTYQPPAGTPGVPPTSGELHAQAAASQVRQEERTTWQDGFDKQESRALDLTTQMDATFVGAIPPMKAIHGQEDPTEPPPTVPSGPGGATLPGTQVPTGGGGGGDGDEARVWGRPEPRGPEPRDPEPRSPEPRGPEPRDPEPKDPTPKGPQLPPPTTTVIGTSQTGVTHTPGGTGVSAPVSGAPAAAGSSGAAMGAAGMAGAAGSASAGAVRGGRAPAAPGRSAAGPVRSIGSTGRSGSASALSRSAGSATARPSAKVNAPRSASGTRAGAPGSAAGRGAAGGRGGAGSRGASGRGAAGSAGGGRGSRTGDRDRTTDRDSLVYDQDWLGDDEVAPGVLD